MNLFWRFLTTYFFSRFKARTDLFSQCSKTFYVLPTDIDLLLHMNNGRYFSMMDIARLDFMLRAKVFSILRKQGIYPVVASEMIRFKKSIKLFQKYSITTEIISWTNKYFYLVHHFIVKDKIYASSLVKSCFLNKAKNIVTPDEILSLFHTEKIAPPLPIWIKDWQAAEDAFIKKK